MLVARRASFLIAGLGLVACTTAGQAPHGAGSASGAGGAGAAGTGGAAPPMVHAEPPPPGPGAPPVESAHLVFAVRRFFFGDTDRNGTPDLESGWKHLGYDLDHRITTTSFAGLCQPRDNADPKRVYPDGDRGIDNSFGRNLLPVFRGLTSDFSSTIQASVEAGRSTVLIAVDGIGPDAAYSPLSARLYAGAPLGHAAAFDGTDVWPVRPESLVDPANTASALVRADASYLVGDTWVGRFTGVLEVELPLGPTLTFHLPIASPVVSMRLDPTHRFATDGVIAGVLGTDRFLAGLERDAVPTVCTSGDPASIVDQLAQASDILRDGTQDPSKTCDGISIGLGFEAVPIALGPVAAPLPPPTNPCAVDAGAPDAG